MESKRFTEHDNSTATKRKPKMIFQHPAMLLALAVVVIAFGAIAAVTFLKTDQPRSDRYQAVFLSTGQVYFGKLKNTTGTYLTLEKTFYTQQQNTPENATAEQKAATSSNVSLVEVGNEVYGPESTLKIRSDQVLFWQDLKSDSKVAKAIDDKK